MKNGTFGKLFIITVSGVSLLFASPARGDATINWDTVFNNFDFDPTSVVIGPGQSVTWQNVDNAGLNLTANCASPHGAYSFSLPNGYYTVLTYPQTGVYNYSDQDGFSATVNVVLPPTVAITSPANNTVFPAPATFTVQATASATSPDYVSDVQFFLGDGNTTNSIDDVFSPPYTTGVTNLSGGAYTLIAVATDAYGLTATSSITIAVTAGTTITLGSPRIAAGQFLFDVTGLTAGKTNIVQVSTDLALWTPVKTNIASSASVTVTNSATLARQFYRVLQLP